MAGAAATAATLAVALPASAGTATPNDPFFTGGDQWALAGAPASINAPRAWPVSTGAGIVVGDVDTGANSGHEDLAGKLIPGARFTDCTGNPSGGGVEDDYGHGSMTTGIMAANTNNGAGIAAVAPDARALIVKVLVPSTDAFGNSTASGCVVDVAAGIRWSADHGANVINVSIGSDVAGLALTVATGDTTMSDAIRYAANKGVGVALAAGNNSIPASEYASVSSVALVVGALAPDGSVASYSTTGSGVNLYAPGGDANQGNDVHHLVVSTSLSSHPYVAEQGTSFAAPHAAGTLALLMSCGLNASQARQRILATAHGMHLDAAAAVSGVGRCGTVPPPGGGGGAAGGGGSGGGGGSRSGGGGGGGAPTTGHSTGAPGPVAAATTPAPAPATPSTASGVATSTGAAAGVAAPGVDPPSTGAAGGSARVVVAGVVGAVSALGVVLRQTVFRRLRRAPQDM